MRSASCAKALGSNVAAYRDALVGTALEVKEKKLVTSESFEVSDAMVDLVVQRLATSGVPLADAEDRGRRRSFLDQLAYEIARYVFGRQAELRRRSQDNSQVQAALDLLRGAPTPRGTDGKDRGEIAAAATVIVGTGRVGLSLARALVHSGQEVRLLQSARAPPCGRSSCGGVRVVRRTLLGHAPSSSLCRMMS